MDEKEKNGDMVGLISIHSSKMAVGGPAREQSSWKVAAMHIPHVEGRSLRTRFRSSVTCSSSARLDCQIGFRSK